MSGCHHWTPVLGLLLFLLLSMVLARPEAGWSSSLPRGQQITSSQQTQQTGNGGLLPFPEGRGSDGTLYKTDYRCEGENMTVSCIDSDGPGLHGIIQVVRANFGRFSIAICNRHGQTDWSVNCMAPHTTKVLQDKCGKKKQCVVPVNSELFHDACPGTHKYLEIHYACLSSNNNPKGGGGGRKMPVLPSWMRPKVTTTTIAPVDKNSVNTVVGNGNENKPEGGNQNKPRKPILVTPGKGPRPPLTTPRIPITTSKPTIPSTTSAPSTSTTTLKTPKSTTEKYPILINPPRVTSERTPINNKRENSSNTHQYSPPQPINPYVTPMTGALACQPVNARGLQWNLTPAGQVALQPCPPISANGLARWYCADTPNGPKWQGTSPDMSDCKSLAITTLERQVTEEDPENVLVSSLAYLTRTKTLYGGDLEALVSIMRTVASRIQYRLQSSSNFHDKVNHIRSVLLNVLRSAANILEGGQRQAWTDLSADRQMKVATSLMLALEENAFLLAEVTEEPEEILETYETLTMTIKVARVSGLRQALEEAIEFPAKPLLYVDDKISLAASDLEDNSQGDLGEAVFFSYRGLHEILSGAKTHLSFEDEKHKDLSDFPSNHWRMNSRIISASLGRGRHIELQSPVTITLRHLESDPKVKSSNPVCVFWDYEVHGWSDSGCRLIETNQTYSVCQCDHLTNFALLVRPLEATVSHLRLDIVACSVGAALFLFLLVVIYMMRTRLKSWCQSTTSVGGRSGHSRGGCRGCLASVYLCRCCCGPESGDKDWDRNRPLNSHLEKCQSFYQGLSQTGPHLGNTGGLSGSLGSSGGHGGPYHPSAFTASAKKSRTLGGSACNGQLTSGLIGSNAHTTSRALNGSQYVDPMTTSGGQLRTLNSTPLMMTMAAGKGPRPHITLNPYSTQLVDNLNMMMPGTGNNNNSSATSGGSNSSASTNSTSLGTPISAQNNHQMTPQLMHLTNTLRQQAARNPENQLPQTSTPSSGQNSGDNVIYRSVSPHGHVYWEIDPNQVYGCHTNTNNNQFFNEESVALLSQQGPHGHAGGQNGSAVAYPVEQQVFSRPYLTSRQGQLTEEDLLLQQHLLAGDPSQVTNGLHDSLHGLQHTNEPQFQPGMVMMASSSNSRGPGTTSVPVSSGNNQSSSFVRQGANRFTRKSNAQPQQPQVATVSAVTSQAAASNQSAVTNTTSSQQNVPEQLQTQVQIRDILPIQVSVKSSEYIEAKIRTLRRDLNKPTNQS